MGVSLNLSRMMFLMLPQAVPTRGDSLIVGAPDVIQPMNGDKSGWEERSGKNGDPFNCTFNPANISFNHGIMSLNLLRNGGAYTSAEYRTADEKYSFGYYETRMKAAKGAGLMSGSFFTYAGVFGQKSHNEIDFEVLGKDPTQVQLNYYYAGTGVDQSNAKLIDLGFDASQGFHNYGFLWSRNSIKWYIDGKLVHTATENIPQNPCKIMVNIWSGTSTVEGWLGGVYGGNGASAQYDWIKYTKVNGENATTPAEEPVNNKPVRSELLKSEPIKNESPENTSEDDSIVNEFMKIDRDQSAPADKIIGEQLFNSLVTSRAAFNGASGGLIGDKMKLVASKSTDAGLACLLRSPIEGHLVFNYSGKVTGGYRDGGFTIIFIKQGPGGDYRKDEQIGEESVVPSKDIKKASFEIPPGTDKINFVLVGSGSVNVEISNIIVTK